MTPFRPSLGIDPGVHGGLAVLRDDGTPARVVSFYPDLEEAVFVDIVTAAVKLLKLLGGRDVWIERVGYIAGDGGQGAFTFGKVYGLLLGGLYGAGGDVDVHRVTPMTWQARMGCLSGGDKNVTKRAAIALFPGMKITHATADALLIARYGQVLRAAIPALGGSPGTVPG